MKSQKIAKAALASVATIAFFGSIHSMADCVPVKGKIFNTLHNPPLAGISTLGVVELKGKDELEKMDCALVGVYAGPGPEDGLEIPGFGKLSKFTHTISCADNVTSPVGTVHSQLTFDTTGTYTGYDYLYTLYFTEHSVPKGGTGTGAFTGTTGGQLEIEGTVNLATSSIDMSFSGEVCK